MDNSFRFLNRYYNLKPQYIQFEQSWSEIREVIYKLLRDIPIEKSVYNETILKIYSLCSALPTSHLDKLYEETKNILTSYVNDILHGLKSQHESILLMCYNNSWTDYKQGLTKLNLLYLYVNNLNLKKESTDELNELLEMQHQTQKTTYPIDQLCMNVWKDNLIVPISKILVKLLFDCIASSRQKLLHFPELVRAVIRSFIEVDASDEHEFYETIFETPFLQWSGQYYKIEADQYLIECSVSDYVKRILRKLEVEEERVFQLLHVSSVDKVRNVFKTHMVVSRLTFLCSDYKHMIQNKRKQDVINLFRILEDIPSAYDQLLNEFYEFVKDYGLSLTSNLVTTNDYVQFVETVADVHKNYAQFIAEVFNDDPKFIDVLHKICACITNQYIDPKKPSNCPELVAKYFDHLLKIGETNDNKLNDAIMVSNYIRDKNLFYNSYILKLCKRLINQKITRLDAEEHVVSSLKKAYCCSSINRLLQNFQEVLQSFEMTDKFPSFLSQHNLNLEVPFSSLVLRTCLWPIKACHRINLKLPEEFTNTLQVFEEFYHRSFRSRKLSWQFHLSQAQLELTYLKKTYLVTMQTFQLAILLLFEKSDALTIGEIQLTLQLDFETVLRNIADLIGSKLLLSNSAALIGDSIIKLNLNFSNKSKKFRITSVTNNENCRAKVQTLKTVEDDRKFFIEAAIVRIMKSKYVMSHKDLIQEVLNMSKGLFELKIVVIKRCIESLIDKEYINRIPDSLNKYVYVS